jgi:aspartyl protease family protein
LFTPFGLSHGGMLRAYLMIIVAIGVAASIFSRAPSSAPAQPQGVQIVGPAAESSGMSVSQPQTVAMLQDGGVQLQRNPNGHFYADVQINAQPIHMLIDTGASGIALSRDDARAAGIATSIGMNDVVGEGADGDVHGEWVMVDRIALGPKTAEHVPAMVLSGGEQSLLGQSFLKQFAAVEIHGDTMTLR